MGSDSTACPDLVAVAAHERLAVCDLVRRRRGFGPEVGICVLAEQRRLHRTAIAPGIPRLRTGAEAPCNREASFRGLSVDSYFKSAFTRRDAGVRLRDAP